MTPELLYIVLILLLIFLPALPLGRYIARVYKGERTWLDFMLPLERGIFRLAGIKPEESMTWQRGMRALLTLNLIFFGWALLILLLQGYIPFWNPDHIPGMEPGQAFNTAVSFMTNTNLQHYSGETGASYFTQLLVFCFLQFVSAATGMAALAMLFKGLVSKQKNDLGNFYDFFLKSATRILLPISVIVAVILLCNGVPATFKGAEHIITLQGDSVAVARGPVAPMVAIKQVGTNGGGFFGPNSAHPFENPTTLTNAVENACILLIPVAMVFAFGYYTERKRFAWVIFTVMFVGFLLLLLPTVAVEMHGNHALKGLHINQHTGSMEGKEVRFGSAASALWAVTTTVTSNGSVNAMHDSFTPLSGAFLLLGMMVNAFFGGVGVGFLNMFVFIILAVFIAGLMVGRTPELMGKKIEAREVKIAALIFLLHPTLIIIGTGIAAYVMAHNHEVGWVFNPGYHGFSTALYEYTSASANNGSGFEGLNDNLSPFWNMGTGIVMLLGRFLPIIGPVAIAGFMASKKYIPEGAGTLRQDSLAFGVILFFVILILSALAFFPALALGPIAEYFS